MCLVSLPSAISGQSEFYFHIFFFRVPTSISVIGFQLESDPRNLLGQSLLSPFARGWYDDLLLGVPCRWWAEGWPVFLKESIKTQLLSWVQLCLFSEAFSFWHLQPFLILSLPVVRPSGILCPPSIHLQPARALALRCRDPHLTLMSLWLWDICNPNILHPSHEHPRLCASFKLSCHCFLSNLGLYHFLPIVPCELLIIHV